jgi:diguanylate cyclase (GGDEF)-like protein
VPENQVENVPSYDNLPAMTYRRTAGSESVLSYCNDYTKELFGYSPEELTVDPPMAFYRLIHPEDRERVIYEIEEVTGPGDDFKLEYRILTRDKQIAWVTDRGKQIRSEQQPNDVYEGIITLLPNHNSSTKSHTNGTVGASRHKNKYDFITELPNRHWFLEKVDAKIQSVLEGSSMDLEYALVFLDLDNFQQINDFFGRNVGDYVIEQMGNVINETFGDHAIVGRISGDRFGLFFPYDPTEDPGDLVANQLGSFERDFEIEDIEITQKFSVGIARFPENGEELENLVTSANRALERAKSRVNEKIAVFKESDLDMLEAEIDARDQILRALDDDRVEVFYQPIVDVPAEETIMHEALLRVDTEDGERLSVNDFKEVIHNGKITRQLDRLIFEKSLKEFSNKIQSNNDLKLAVNLFPPSVIDPGCFEDINKLVQEYGFPPEQLVIEIPETLMLSHRERATENVQRAAEDFSFRFALDDFGVGHGSFKSLKTLPLDYLKIDGTFVQDLSSSGVEQKFVEMTAGLSRKMDLKVIGEWIETEETAELLENLGVPYHQGYYYAHPAPAADWED